MTALYAAFWNGYDVAEPPLNMYVMNVNTTPTAGVVQYWQSGAHTWVAPTNVTSVQVEAWGGGGGGAGANNNTFGAAAVVEELTVVITKR